jgi:hypothetical protein
MKMVRQVIVFDAADLGVESAFWAGILGGHVFEDDNLAQRHRRRRRVAARRAAGAESCSA